MPFKPLKPCSQVGCKELTRERFCEAHKQHAPGYDRYRGSATRRGYDSKWRNARLGYLQTHPLCVECMKENRVEPATVVDHIKPHRGDKKLFWDKSNWQSLCKRHHDVKTATEDGGFGR